MPKVTAQGTARVVESYRDHTRQSQRMHHYGPIVSDEVSMSLRESIAWRALFAVITFGGIAVCIWSAI